MNAEDARLLREAMERAFQKAQSFFESLTDDQRAAADPCGEAPERCELHLNREEIASGYENAGILCREQYLEMTRVTDLVQNGQTLGEPELHWMFGLLAGTDQTILRARVMACLEVLLTRFPDDPVLAARVERAIAPFRQGPEDLDILHWGRIRQLLDHRAAKA